MENAIHSVSSSIGSAAPLKREVADYSVEPLTNSNPARDLKEAAGLSVEKLAPSFGKPPELDLSPLSAEAGGGLVISGQEMAVAVEQVSSFLQFAGTNLELRVDAEAGNQPVVSIYDGEDGSLLRQYPTDEMLEIARKITEQMNEFRNSLVNGGAPPSVRGLFTNTVV